MLYRLCFAAVALFWIVMNVLLWRSEFRGQGELGSAIPVEVVWAKILTAPDDSALEILHRGEKLGYCRWRANVGEELRTGKVGQEGPPPEGMVKHLTGYTIDFEGNLLLPQSSTRMRFEFHGEFETDHSWTEVSAKASVRPNVWELKAVAADETVTLHASDGSQEWERLFKFEDFRQPDKLWRELGTPLPMSLFPSLGLGMTGTNLSLGLSWQARNDWFTIGRSKVRVYRMQAKLFDRYDAVAIVSRVGEILRLELPSGIILVNDALVNL